MTFSHRTLSRPDLSDIHSEAWIGLFYALTVGVWSIGGWLLGMSLPYAVGMLVITGHLAWQIWRLDLSRPEVNFRLFLSNVLTGVLLACGAFIRIC